MDGFSLPYSLPSNMTFKRKRNRLPLDTYKEARVFHIVIGIHKRHCLLKNDNVVLPLIESLRSSSDKFGWDVITYCFMPDHVHLLIAPNKIDTDLIAYIKDFKQRTGYWYKQSFNEPLWQKSYYDHILRDDEAVLVIAQYILENPFRAKLTQHWFSYPYSGSFVLNVNDLR